jgi:F0F1-type ATP synthase membrane subunit b/b'
MLDCVVFAILVTIIVFLVLIIVVMNAIEVALRREMDRRYTDICKRISEAGNGKRGAVKEWKI